MNILNRYLLGKLSFSIMLILSTFVILILLVQILRFLDFVLEDGVSLSTLVLLSISMMPNLIIEVIPFAFIVGVIFIWNNLNSNQELIIMQSCGLAPIALAKNIIYIGIFISFIIFLFAIYLSPLAYKKYVSLRNEIGESFNLKAIEVKKFTKIKSGLTFYLDDRDGNTMKQLIIHSQDYEKGPLTIFAEKGFVEQDGDNMIILLDKATIMQRNNENNSENILFLDKYIFSFVLNRKIEVSFDPYNEKTMSLWELIGYKNIPFLQQIPQNSMAYINFTKAYILEKNRRLVNIMFPILLGIITSYFFISASFKRVGSIKPIIKSIGVAGILKAINIGIIYTKPNESLSFSIFMLYIVLGILVLLRIYFPPNLKQMNTSIINKYMQYITIIFNRIFKEKRLFTIR
jgi:lipopolysaccharide export LptBFGC system permease protein LptF